MRRRGGGSQDENGNSSMYQVATPEISPNGETYNSAQTVTITCATEDAAIYYTINGDKPSTSSTEYTGQIPVNKTTIVRAIAYKDGWKPSEEVQAIYTIEGTVSYPTFTPESGTYDKAQTITISCATEEVNIYYTTGTTIPSESSTNYTSPFNIDKTTIINAIAYKDGKTSKIAQATYIIKGTVATPTFNPPKGGTIKNNQKVYIYCSTDDAAIYYTIDGTEPTDENGLVYNKAMTFDRTTTVKARAYKEDCEPSEVAEITYTIKDTVANPTFSPPSTSYFNSQTITINCITEGANIHYNINNNNDPTTTSGTVYTAPFTIYSPTNGTTVTIKAIAYKTGSTKSEVMTATYEYLELHGTIKINNKEVQLPESDYILQGPANNPTLKWVWGDGKNPYLEMNQYNGTYIEEGTLKNITIKVKGDSTLDAGASSYALYFSQGVHIEGSTSGRKLTLKGQNMRVVYISSTNPLTAKNINLTIEGDHTVNPEANLTYVVLGNVELQDKAILNLTGYRDWSGGGAGESNAHAIDGIYGTLTLDSGSSANINVTGHEYTTNRIFGVNNLILNGGTCEINLGVCPICGHLNHPPKAVMNQPTVPDNYNTTGAWDSNYVKYTRK